MQCKAVTIAPCICWRAVPWDEHSTLIKFTDDLAWNGSARTKGFFAELLAKEWTVTIDHFWKNSVGMKIDCIKYVELTQPRKIYLRTIGRRLPGFP